MALSEEMQKMVEAVKKFDVKLRDDNDLYGHYFAPDIPDKILKKNNKKF